MIPSKQVFNIKNPQKNLYKKNAWWQTGSNNNKKTRK